MVVMEKEKRFVGETKSLKHYCLSVRLRISELEDTLKAKSAAEKVLEQQKQACDCHVMCVLVT